MQRKYNKHAALYFINARCTDLWPVRVASTTRLNAVRALSANLVLQEGCQRLRVRRFRLVLDVREHALMYAVDDVV
jgi:hypothetical protein